MEASKPPTSLHRLTIDNQNFAVNPLFWTSRHLFLVNCSFQEVEDMHKHVKPRDDHDESLTEDAELLVTDDVLSEFYYIDELLARRNGVVKHDR